jgi:hypothetical protein
MILLFIWIVIITGITLALVCGISLRTDRWDQERGLAELTEEDRNLLKRHIRALEDNTASNKRGRP